MITEFSALLKAAALPHYMDRALDNLLDYAIYHRTRMCKTREADLHKAQAGVLGTLYHSITSEYQPLNDAQVRWVLAFSQALDAYANRIDRAVTNILERIAA